jgi:hypothetical protein
MKPILKVLCALAATIILATPTLRAQEPDVRTNRLLAADKGKVAILNTKGEVEWEVENRYTCHDIAMLPNGNILMPTSNTRIVEMTPAKSIVWQHESKLKEGYDGAVEVHGFQRLDNGRTMIAESGNRRIIEVDAGATSCARFL